MDEPRHSSIRISHLGCLETYPTRAPTNRPIEHTNSASPVFFNADTNAIPVALVTIALTGETSKAIANKPNRVHHVVKAATATTPTQASVTRTR